MLFRSEARKIIEESGAGDVVSAHPEKVADLWRELAANRAKLLTGTSGRDWVHDNANVDALADTYAELLITLVDGVTTP